MYAISYIHARSKQAVERILGMDEEQRKLYDLVDMSTRSWNLGVPMTKTGNESWESGGVAEI